MFKKNSQKIEIMIIQESLWMTLAFHKISRIRGIPDNEEIGISFQSWYCDFSIIKELLYLIVHYILIWIVLLLFPNIEIQKQLLEKEGEKKMNDLQNEIIKDREENQANVDAYKKEKSAQANKQLYSPDYVKLEMAKALSQNTKFYFSGETSPLGSLLNKLLGDN